MDSTVASSSERAASSPDRVGSRDTWTLEPRTSGVGARLREVWAYRRLLRFFGGRAIARLYRNTILGKAWIFLRPLVPLLVKTMIFGALLRVGSDGVPYFLFLVVGTAAWDLFASSVMWATRSLEINRSLIGKVYVPRVILPLAMMAPGFVYFGIHVGVAAAALAYYYQTTGVLYLNTSPELLWTLIVAPLIVVFALAIGLFTSVLATYARDVRLTLAFVLDFWVFLTPVLYPLSTVPADWRWLMLLNPMAAYVETFKYGVLGVGGIDWVALGSAVGVTGIILVAGLAYFGRAETHAVDRV